MHLSTYNPEENYVRVGQHILQGFCEKQMLVVTKDTITVRLHSFSPSVDDLLKMVGDTGIDVEIAPGIYKDSPEKSKYLYLKDKYTLTDFKIEYGTDNIPDIIFYFDKSGLKITYTTEKY